MGKQRKCATSSTGSGAWSEDWTHVLSVGVVVASILVVLVLGAVLRPSEEDRIAHDATTVTVPADDPAIREAPVHAEPAPSAPAPVHRPGGLAARVRADAARLAATGDPWTAQLMLLCDQDRAEAIVDRFGRHDSLHVLPRLHEDRPCFLISWGHYPDPERARAAADLPPELRELQQTPLPKRIAEVLR